MATVCEVVGRSLTRDQIRNNYVDPDTTGTEDCPQFLLDHLLTFYPGPYAMLSAYLDEAGTDAGSPAMCVAGLLYPAQAIKHLNREWKKALEHAGVSHFHTVDYCHSRGEFEDKDRALANWLYKTLIALIRKYSCGGAVVYTLPEKQFDAIRDRYGWEYSQYTTCAHFCMRMLIRQAKLQGHREVSFVIESGHPKMGEFNRLIRQFRQHGYLPGPCQFSDKRDIRPLQSADIFAYELRKFAREKLLKSNRPLRKSLQGLVVDTRRTHRVFMLSKRVLEYLFCRESEMLATWPFPPDGRFP